MVWRWYNDANILDISDIHVFRSGNFRLLKEIKYIPPSTPKCIKFIKLDKKWNDKNMIKKKMQFFSDGSIHYDCYDKKAQIFGYGGGAVTIYKNGQLLDIIINPLSTRTHINIAELSEFEDIFSWIIKNKKMALNNDGIDIITDSQNCYKMLNHTDYTEDDVMTDIQKNIRKLLQNNIYKNMRDNFIEIHWVESHTESEYNDEVDGIAKAASKIAQYLGDNNTMKQTQYNPNQYIAFETIKGEIKYKKHIHQKEKWNDYIIENASSDKRANHLKKWNIDWDIKYSQELIYLNKHEANIRMLLYINHLPLNEYKNYRLRGKNGCTPYCEQIYCINKKIPETIYHFMVECKTYDNYRKIRNDKLKKILINHNDDTEKEKNKIKYIENIQHFEYLKQFIFPSFKIKQERRIEILRTTINYIIQTNRINIKRF